MYVEEKGWLRPQYDRKLRLVDDYVNDLEAALPHIKGRRICVQAGGAYGVWPFRLSEFFQSVYTFEPDHLNFNCLVHNLRERPNVVKMQAALGDLTGLVSVQRDEFEKDNAGAGYVVRGGTIPVIRVDDLQLPALDFLCLDVEGYELEALRGARSSIMNFSPTIMIENKKLPHMKTDPQEAIDWLVQRRRYRVTENVHRDVILVPESS